MYLCCLPFPHSKTPQAATFLSPATRHLEHQSSTLRLLITTVQYCQQKHLGVEMRFRARTYPSSKCLQRFSASWHLALHLTHSNRNTIFFVVLAFLWKTGFV